ncbi:MAG: YkgJ family cysteine cluster protein, partial [Candidatus Bathyarchaeia archaeon]|nr:YkgJ family cysteine cluster protein [Candidatus Bathyarchaeia archaeon]
DFEYPENVRFKCEKCAICCGDTKERVRHVLLLEVEARRIAMKTSKILRSSPKKLKMLNLTFYQMRKNAEGKCVFLEDSLCSIYQIRPLICKFYPFQLKNTKNGGFEFTYTNECPNIGRGPKLKKRFFEKLFREFMKIRRENSSH